MDLAGKNTLAQILDIREIRAARAQTQNSTRCYCDAARAAREYFSRQLTKLYSLVSKPRVLCLDTLEEGVPVVPGGWNFVYSASLFSSLPESAARQVVKSALSRLAPGGWLLIANVRSEICLDRCPLCLQSGSTQRGETSMIDLTKDLPLDAVTAQLVFRDRLGLNVYLELHKNASTSLEVPSYRKIA